ncbi:UDP-glucosyltransferase 2-like [Bacillus rossius redtenbacheri]|uniref:UDP-glucosyltransferase 2-like n=1 Tax=Bacillus rossius redtenbacheri TaxID=93214 RepID=UPI002FDE6F58
MNISAAAIFLAVMCANVHGGCGARILGVFDFNSKSHFRMFEVLLKALAARGHEVVVLGHFPQKKPVPNYTDIDVSDSVPQIVDNFTVKYVQELRFVSLMEYLWVETREICRKSLSHPNARALLRSDQKFDLVITEVFGSECAAGFAHRFDAPLVSIVSCVAFPWTHGRLGNPDHPAYVPSYTLPYTDRMTFWQRVVNALYHVFFEVGNHVFNDAPTHSLLKELFGADVPTVGEIHKRTSLVLVNSHFSVNGPRPAVPGFVEVAGLHIQPPGELPQDLQTFLDESEHGVVYFSLGSLVQVQSFSPEKLQALLDAFAALPERVLLKYTGSELPGKPYNVMVRKWLPQLEILSHPKVKVFISHGGLMSTLESVYAGVPMIGMPLFADQDLNIMRMMHLGMATMLKYNDLTKDTLLQNIRTVIDDKRYSESARRVSALFRDRPATALQSAVFWTEYVLRHGGAPHLRTAAADMPLHRYLLLDLAGALLLAVCAALCAARALLRALLAPRAKSKAE